jgi:long-subunit fatty acid transport protein
MKLSYFFLLSVTALSAQDFYWNTVSARSLGMGGVYVPSNTGALDALAANPAGLTAIGAPAIDANLTSVFARGSFTNSVNQNSPIQTPPGLLPFGAFGTPVEHSRFSLGLGILPEMLSVSQWHYVDAPGAAGTTYGSQFDKSAIIALRAVAGVGVSLGHSISIGATFGVDYNQNHLETPYIFQEQPVLAGLKTLLNLKTTGTGENASVGILANPTRRIKLGAAWKSRTVIHSTGHAAGNAGQLFENLGIPNPAGFTYNAAVRNVLPQSVMASALWQANPRWTFALQGDWVNWGSAFRTLPVALTNGTNATINSLLNSTSLIDGVPLHWKDQYSFHGGVERVLTENISIRAGYAHANDPVPSSTLSPLTAAIMKDQLTTGIGYRVGRARFDLSYGIDLTAKQSVAQSALLAGEYSNSTVRIGTQSLTLGTSFSF